MDGDADGGGCFLACGLFDRCVWISQGVCVSVYCTAIVISHSVMDLVLVY